MVVFDEMPYLARDDHGFEGTLQKAFDRTLSRLPVLLVLIGSDLAMMEALNTYGRPSTLATSPTSSSTAASSPVLTTRRNCWQCPAAERPPTSTS